MKSWVKLYYHYYRLETLLLSVIMHDGSFASEDLFGFLTDGDFQALGRRPNGVTVLLPLEIRWQTML